MASIPQADTKAYTKDEARAFKELFPDIVRELTYDGPYKDVPTVNAHIAKVFKDAVKPRLSKMYRNVTFLSVID